MDSDRLDRILEEIGHLSSEVHDMKESVQRLDYDVRGNGQPGLKMSLNTLKSRVDTLYGVLKWILGAVTTLGTALIIWLVTR